MLIPVPLNKKVVVEPESRERQSAGGIIIPETVNQKAPTKGRVLAIADDSDINLKVAPGDLVLFSKYSGVEIMLKGQNGAPDRLVLIMKDEDLLALIEERNAHE